jgi:Uma2 family endonuclease
MVTPMATTSNQGIEPLRIAADDLPVLYEDDEEGELGESNPHVCTDRILHICLLAHLADRPGYRVFSNMNLYYLPEGARGVPKRPYVSPDTMVVVPFQPLGENIASYQIGKDGPVPALTIEVLSERSAQQRDLAEKAILYAKLGVLEYILVDSTGRFLPQKLLLKKLQPDQSWLDMRDSDGGVTSKLGFRLGFDAAGRLQVVDSASGRAYVRPTEAEQKMREAEQKVRELEAELVRLRQAMEKKA